MRRSIGLNLKPLDPNQIQEAKTCHKELAAYDALRDCQPVGNFKTDLQWQAGLLGFVDLDQNKVSPEAIATCQQAVTDTKVEGDFVNFYCYAAECNKDSLCAHMYQATPIRRHTCDLRRMVCVECLSDDQCSAAGKVCHPRGTCEDCYSNEHCKDVSRSQCSMVVTNYAQCTSCSHSSHCAHLPSTPNCRHGQCVPRFAAGEPCNSLLNDKCVEGFVCGTGKKCVSVCATDEQCKTADPTRPICMLGTCMECDGNNRKRTGACLGHMSAPGQYGIQPCTPRGTCRACYHDGMCGTAYVCDERTNRCKSCVTDGDCVLRIDRGGPKCIDSKCQECSEDAHCLRFSPKRSQCDVARGRCVPCNRDAGCRFDSRYPKCRAIGCSACVTQSDCALNQFGLTQCRILDPPASLDRTRLPLESRCSACVRLLRRTVYDETTEQPKGFIAGFNAGCPPTEVCLENGGGGPHNDSICTRCSEDTRSELACNNPLAPRCSGGVCMPCLTNADCAHVRGSAYDPTQGVRETRPAVCKVQPDGNSRCVECATTADCYLSDSTRGFSCNQDTCQRCLVVPAGNPANRPTEGSCEGEFECELVDWANTYQCRPRAGLECGSLSMVCAQGSVCRRDPSSGLYFCKMELGQPCQHDSDCAGDLRCHQDALTGHQTCVECVSTIDCWSAEKNWGACSAAKRCEPCDQSRARQCNSDTSSRQFVCDLGICGVCNATHTAACTRPGLSACFNGRCAACRTDADCTFVNRQFCRDVEPRIRECVECTPDGDPACPAGFRCSRTFMCEPTRDLQSGFCRDDRDCSDRSPICNQVARICQGCSEEKQCKAKLAGSDLQLEARFPNVYACDNARCVECVDASQCRQGLFPTEYAWQVCADNKCRSCSSNGLLTCPDYAPYCNVGAGLCQECRSTYDCVTSHHSEACVAGNCIPCDADTAPCGSGYVCDEETRTCVQCTEEDWSQCALYGKRRVCARNTCVQCNRAGHCEDQLACIDHTCQPCAYNRDCNRVLGDQYQCVRRAANGSTACVGQNTVQQKRLQEEEKKMLNEPRGPFNMVDAGCPTGYYQCVGETLGGAGVEDDRCLRPDLVCDGTVHCQGGEDESTIACVIYKNRQSAAAAGSPEDWEEQKTDSAPVRLMPAAACVLVMARLWALGA